MVSTLTALCDFVSGRGDGEGEDWSPALIYRG